MANTDFKSVDEYFTTLPKEVQTVLQAVRKVLRKAMPGTDEVISYQIAAYKLHGAAVLYFAGWKEHFSIYPATAGLVQAFGDELEPYRVSKGTLRFALDKKLPTKLIERIAKFRLQETANLVMAREARKSKKKRTAKKKSAKKKSAKKKKKKKKKSARKKR
jgi:uncharacterized protein YdhG (YjbR/CyaY superfamily)